MNGFDLLLMALVVVGAFVVWLLREAERLDRWEDDRERRFYDEVLGAAADDSIEATLSQIRGLPEVPFDRAREDAA